MRPASVGRYAAIRRGVRGIPCFVLAALLASCFTIDSVAKKDFKAPFPFPVWGLGAISTNAAQFLVGDDSNLKLYGVAAGTVTAVKSLAGVPSPKIAVTDPSEPVGFYVLHDDDKIRRWRLAQGTIQGVGQPTAPPNPSLSSGFLSRECVGDLDVAPNGTLFATALETWASNGTLVTRSALWIRSASGGWSGYYLGASGLLGETAEPLNCSGPSIVHPLVAYDRTADLVYFHDRLAPFFSNDEGRLEVFRWSGTKLYPQGTVNLPSVPGEAATYIDMVAGAWTVVGLAVGGPVNEVRVLKAMPQGSSKPVTAELVDEESAYVWPNSHMETLSVDWTTSNSLGKGLVYAARTYGSYWNTPPDYSMKGLAILTLLPKS